MRRAALVVAALLSAAAAPAAHGEYRSVAQPAVLYDGPSKQARRAWIAPRGMPVEVVSTLGGWVKVRDMAGDVVWIERADLGERHTVVASMLATVRQQPQEGAPVVLQADRGVLLEIGEAPNQAPGGWLRVRHRDGGSGWVRTAEVWGW